MNINDGFWPPQKLAAQPTSDLLPSGGADVLLVKGLPLRFKLANAACSR